MTIRHCGPIFQPDMTPPADWQLDVDPAAEPEAPPPLPPAEAPKPRAARPAPTEAPPPVERIVEAALFVGGPPLTAEAVVQAIRGMTAERVAEVIDGLNAAYRAQRRPYTVEPRGGGWVLVGRPDTAAIRERLHGGPRAARLTQPAVDVLGLVAFRQPVAKAELDALRGADAAGPLRQLVKLGLVTVRKDAGGYATTPRFLEAFHLTSLDDLPRPVG
jgi:chromosome segregation and condensation protein ScpB